MAEYVYGVVAAGTAVPDGTGIDDAPLRLIEQDELAALVSTVDNRDITLGRFELLAHARVLSDALAYGTVLPMRFGVVFERPDEVCERLLAGHDRELREQLRTLSGKVEIDVRATYDEQRILREVVRDRLDIARLSERSSEASYVERIKLGELIADAVGRAREVDSQNILDALSTVAVAVDLHAPGHERVACNAAFLVERERMTEFDSVLDAFADGQDGRLRFKCSGPLPPHSFVQFAGAA